MSTIDLSRSATDYRKHYKSVRAQQGRVFVDDDHNDNERIHTEEQRRDLVDIIGPSGVPGDGFKISNPRLTNVKVELAVGEARVGDFESVSWHAGGSDDVHQIAALLFRVDALVVIVIVVHENAALL